MTHIHSHSRLSIAAITLAGCFGVLYCGLAYTVYARMSAPLQSALPESEVSAGLVRVQGAVSDIYVRMDEVGELFPLIEQMAGEDTEVRILSLGNAQPVPKTDSLLHFIDAKVEVSGGLLGVLRVIERLEKLPRVSKVVGVHVRETNDAQKPEVEVTVRVYLISS